MPIAIIVEWYGPYTSLQDFKKEASAWGKGSRTLYMGISNGDAPSTSTINYIGLSTSPSSRFGGHPKMKDPINNTYYLGEIATAGLSGRRTRKTPTDLHIAEGALIYKLQPKLNVSRKSALPEDCVVIYSRFWDRNDGITPMPTPDFFPELIAYNWYTQSWS
ncbi:MULTISPECIES: hypothetical protein [Pacificibacter]|uniref:hypothetical protein n=1 Tax=Pacificibacter TaxID=1042323 RepID=UPI001C08F730|nr:MULTISPECIES: hypothetical protein [Pacificibacter]MBU2935084.1 hypothetical protein [Pacificibacter marinus]MDO6615874.1 hypothetical protein [Pacificibacter sp. 1_MG-2023]